MPTDDVRARIAEAAMKAKELNIGGKNWINGSAIYELTLLEAREFEGYKSASQALLKFRVDSVQNLESDEAYKARGVWPKKQGEEVAFPKTLLDPFKQRLFLEAVSALMHCEVDDLYKDVVVDGKPQLTFMTLLQHKGDKNPSPMVGLKVRCQALHVNREGKHPITSETWTGLPVPADHPLFSVIVGEAPAK